jgi:hypothetical protein
MISGLFSDLMPGRKVSPGIPYFFFLRLGAFA